MFSNMDDPGRDFDEMWYGHASQLMSVRGHNSRRAAIASLALMRLVFIEDPDFKEWFDKRKPVTPSPAEPAMVPAKAKTR